MLRQQAEDLFKPHRLALRALAAYCICGLDSRIRIAVAPVRAVACKVLC